MKKLSVGEIIGVLVSNNITVGNFVRSAAHHRNTIPGLGKIQTVQTPDFEDYEEQGRNDEGMYVTHFCDHDVYIGTPAQVDSYGDNETYPYGYGKEVFPKEKVVKVYE